MNTVDRAEMRSPASGDQLTERILMHPSGGVEALIKLAEGQETEWLEFKAATRPAPGNMKPNENEADYRWHVARSAIGMLNTRGGVILIGLDDEGRSVGIEASCPDGVFPDASSGREKFVRERIMEGVFSPKGGWKTSKTKWTLDRAIPANLILPMPVMPYDGKLVLPVLVRPLPDDAKPVMAEDSTGNREVLLVRDAGAQGRVHELFRHLEIQEHIETRKRFDPVLYEALWKKFLDTRESVYMLNLAWHEEINYFSNKYHSAFQRTCEGASRFFIPLDAEERVDWNKETNLFEPLVERYLKGELDWKTEGEDGYDGNCQEDENGDIELVNRECDREGVFSLLRRENRAVLLGEPGSGKTTCLKRLALESAGSYAEKRVLSLFVPLSRYCGKKDLWPLMARCTMVERNRSLSKEQLEWLAQNNRLQLLLDALNECPIAYGMECVEEIRELLNRFPGMSVVLTSRVTTYKSVLELPVFLIRPMSRDQQMRFLLAHFDNDEQRASDILDQFTQRSKEERLVANPLILRLVVESVRGGRTLPHGRTALYSQFVDRWYERESIKAKNSGGALSWSREQTVSALSLLAFEGRRGGNRCLPVLDAEEILQRELQNPRGFLEQMGQGLLLSYDTEDNSVSFIHETFQEYLSAEYTALHPEVRAVATQALSSDW